MDLETAQTNTTAKLPLLKQENGNSFKPVAQTTTNAKGTSTILIPGPITADEKTQKKNDVKARSMLLMAHLNEHLLIFNQYKDAKTFFAAIQIRFDEDLNLNFLRSLPSEWNTQVVVWRNKPNLDIMSFDDLYNNFKIVKQEVKGTTNSSSSSSSQNMAFVSSPRSTSEVNTAYGVSTDNIQVSTTSTQDFEQIHEDDLEEIYLKWQLVLLSMRTRRFFHKTGRKITINGSDTAGYDRSKVECFNCHNFGHFARECRGPRNQGNRSRNQDISRRTINVEEISSKAMLAIDEAGFDWSYMADDEVPTNMSLMAFSDSEPEFEGYGPKTSKSINEDTCNEVRESPDAPLVEELVSNDKLENFDHLQANCNYHQRERVVSGNNYKRVNYNYSAQKANLGAQRNMVPRAVLKKTGLRTLNTARPVNTAHPKTTVYSARPMSHFSKSAQSTVKRPYQIRTTLTNKNFSQKVNTAKGKLYTGRPKVVNTARPNRAVVNAVRANQVNAVKASACWGHPQKEDQGYVDSGCSRHMTGNMSYLSDFKEFDGGYVTFGGGVKVGRITGKETLKTGKLDFEDVYFVKELQFNLFSVSQMCDKKNSVFFTDTGCFVLSPDFKLTDESQVLHKVTRKNNMYSVDMKNIVPKESLTCLVAKATLDESMLWHRRLASKDETSGILKSFITQIENLVDKKVKIIRCDNGTEFKNRVMTDSKLPTTFWAEAINTTCYVQNKVLVVKPHNKTLYELFRGRTPSLRFMRPFVCHVTILNTLDHLGKFNGKSDDGFFVGYSLNSKAFRVYNIRTRKVKENLHVRFLDDKPIIAGDGPKWLFDIDVIIEAMHYVPVVAGTNSNDFVGTKESIGTGQSNKETGSSQDYILMPLWKDGSKPENSSPDVNTTGSNINTASINTCSLNINTASPTVITAPLEAKHADFFRDETELDISNISTTYQVPSTPITRIHKDHSLDNVIGDVLSSVQTRRMTKTTNEQGFISAVYKGKTHEDLHTCLFACFLSQEEAKMIAKALRFEDLDYLDKVYKVVKALYGLHQASRACSIKKELCTEFEKLMHDKFQMSSMGELTFFLGLQVKQKEDGIFINQDKYVAKILRKFGFTNVRTTSTPMDTDKPLLKDSDGDDVDVYLYRSMIGSLMYLTSSRPDIIDSSFNLVAYSDSDYARSSLDRKSTTGGCQFLGCRLILWQCKKQNVVATSSTKAKYVAAATNATVIKEWDDRMERAATTISSLEAKQDSGNINMTQSMATLNEAFPQGTSSERELVRINIDDGNAFWNDIKVKTGISKVNTASTLDSGEIQITATIDGKVKIIIEASIRMHLKLEDSDGISTLPTTKFFEQLALMGPKKTAWEQFSSNIATAIIFLTTNKTFNFSKLIFDGMESEVPQPRSPTLTPAADEAASTGVDVRHGGAATTVSSLDAGQGSGNIDKTPTMPYDSPLPRVYTLGSDEGRMQHNELMDLVTKLSDRVLALETDLRTAGAAVTTAGASISTVCPPRVSTAEDISTAETLVYIRRSVAKDKGKAKMDESELEQTKTKLRKRQERVGYGAAEEIQATIEADEELSQRIQAEEREKYSEAEKARLLAELINQRKRYFAQQRAEERRNKPLIQDQQRTYMSNYIKHMVSHTLQQLKRLSFDELKNLFKATMRRVGAFVPMKTEIKREVPRLAAGSSKRDAEEEIDQGSSKRQKTGENSEPVEESKKKEDDELSQEEL
ncbi:putative ribonuclease H-like domain-containing protein [Tanacetum coccineum]|uniref:Ribonuclease H-like domain-containing protein n=1 Tax=Tanacetum coccineum TaxID=301880 RepID=A0ABQ5E7F5_9ASTR